MCAESGSLRWAGDNLAAMFVSRSRGRMLVVTYCIVAALNNVLFSVISPFFPYQSSKLGGSKIAIGFAFSAYSASSLIASPLGGKPLVVNQ